MPSAPSQTKVSRRVCQPAGWVVQAGKMCSASCQPIHTTAMAPVQRGTNRPSGNTYRNKPKQAAPRKCSRATGVCKPGWSAARAGRVNPKVAVPKISSAREANTATRSSRPSPEDEGCDGCIRGGEDDVHRYRGGGVERRAQAKIGNDCSPAAGSCPSGRSASGRASAAARTPTARRRRTVRRTARQRSPSPAVPRTGPYRAGVRPPYPSRRGRGRAVPASENGSRVNSPSACLTLAGPDRATCHVPLHSCLPTVSPLPPTDIRSNAGLDQRSAPTA